jgi:23S rRNA (adenine-N6)-dimethyltransferase
MIVDNQKSLAQNFLVKSCLAASLLNGSSIDQEDTVYEIGSGKGILTRQLVRRAKRVIAIEKDHDLFVQLLRKFEHTDNIIIHHADFLSFKIEESHYKVFANLPFNMTSAIVRKLAFASNPPEDAYLIVQKEAAQKFVGAPKTTQFSLLIKPWFRLRISRSLKRTDFSPVPNVDTALLQIAKRECPLVQPTDKAIYERFVKHGFGAWKKNLKSNYKNIFSYKQWKRLSRDLDFPIHAQPSELSLRQWLGLFALFKQLK